jgi:capsular exopolysaccharide synthesis family protein
VPGVVAPHKLAAAAAEPFRLLRANLKYSAGGGGLTSIAVTSASPGEGKSVVAWNLAAASAQAGTATLLIDTDIRQARLGGRTKEASAPGLSDMLVGDVWFDDALVTVPVVDDPEEVAAPAVFDLLFAGTPTQTTIELLESERMNAVLAEATECYDLVILDTSPAAFLSETIPLLKMVDGVLVVSRLGSTTRDAACRLRDQLNTLRVPILGVALNHARRQLGGARGHYLRQAEPRLARSR